MSWDILFESIEKGWFNAFIYLHLNEFYFYAIEDWFPGIICFINLFSFSGSFTCLISLNLVLSLQEMPAGIVQIEP